MHNGGRNEKYTFRFENISFRFTIVEHFVLRIIDVMEKLGYPLEDKPYYNDYALYVAMNQVVSDHGETIASILNKDSIALVEPTELAKYAYKLALDLLKDKDLVYDIREYFLK